jgi:hypothetical protein
MASKSSSGVLSEDEGVGQRPPKIRIILKSDGVYDYRLFIPSFRIPSLLTKDRLLLRAIHSRNVGHAVLGVELDSYLPTQRSRSAVQASRLYTRHVGHDFQLSV